MKKMKKMITLLLVLVALTACNEEGSDNRQAYTVTINNRAYWDGVVIFSQNTADIEINHTKNTIKISSHYKDIDGQLRSLNTPELEMTSSYGTPYTVYSFSTTDEMGDGVKKLYGSIDISTGMVRYAFQQDNHTIICTSHLLYNNATTTISDVAGANIEHNMSSYLFMLDSKGETCVMQISAFVPGVNGAVQEAVVEYKGLDVAITDEGFNISADQAHATQGNYYDLTDVHVTIDWDCNNLSGSFKTKISQHEFHGNLFFTSNLNPPYDYD